MALPTEFVVRRLTNPVHTRVDEMLLWNLMTGHTLHRRVFLNQFLGSDASMADAAIFQSLGRHGIVRVMTGHARLARIVLSRDDLWKPCGPCGIVIVAKRTTPALTWSFRFDRIVLGMGRCRPVTNLAGNATVEAFGLLLKNFLVTTCTDIHTGVIHRKISHFIDRVCTIVAIPAE